MLLLAIAFKPSVKFQKRKEVEKAKEVEQADKCLETVQHSQEQQF